MDEYVLFLDESYTYEQNGKNSAFAVGGFIIKTSNINSVNNKIDVLKREIWSDLPNPTSIILHELDLKNALKKHLDINKLKTEYVRFRNNKKLANKVYARMSKIVKDSDIYTIGCVVKNEDYYTNFPKGIGNEISLVCMQIILENYTHFLFKNNAVGKIVYESRDSMDKTMLMRFYQVSSIGTMYVKPEAIQQKITQFSFVHKSDNSQCLQLADFMVNQMARKKSGKKVYKNVSNLTKSILFKSYDGTNGNNERFGIKTIPRIVSKNA
ncbi:DUF3800 domain-containing protein [uncultured Eubacterium sp.]|uniref:DUF3800 domain-containing protein n=1 Tax=uncultured Eubacterium sp. TaxID=165185 RepID=UPI002597290A|nr:DUF3800 domain-containing protein [uncultured Eubacterium sp.]